MPLDSYDNKRLEQFIKTKQVYDVMSQKKEFIIPTRSAPQLRRYLDKHNLNKDVRMIPYVHKKGFNCSKALNIGVRNAKFPHIIITSPEVIPLTPVLKQLESLLGSNVVCQVFDENQNGDRSWSLVNHRPLSRTPGYYFLAMFNKVDIEKINGWDEEFMKGYAYEDADFGNRWVRANLPFMVRCDIQAVHQYHPREETLSEGGPINLKRYELNNAEGLIQCHKGLRKL